MVRRRGIDPAGHLTLESRERFASSMQIIEELSALRSLVRETDAIWLTYQFVIADDLASGTLQQLPVPAIFRQGRLKSSCTRQPVAANHRPLLQSRSFPRTLRELSRRLPRQPISDAWIIEALCTSCITKR